MRQSAERGRHQGQQPVGDDSIGRQVGDQDGGRGPAGTLGETSPDRVPGVNEVVNIGETLLGPAEGTSVFVR